MTAEQRQYIRTKRNEIRKKFSELLKKAGSQSQWNEIEGSIYFEHGTDVFGKIIEIFNVPPQSPGFDELVDLTMDAWNYFPHKSLDGLSPAEKRINRSN